MPGLESFLHACPKVELHCHLFGTVRRQTFFDLAHAANAPLSDAEISAFYTRGDKPVGVLRVLRALDTWLIRSGDDLYRIVPKSLVADESDFAFAWKKRKEELWALWTSSALKPAPTSKLFQLSRVLKYQGAGSENSSLKPAHEP